MWSWAAERAWRVGLVDAVARLATFQTAAKGKTLRAGIELTDHTFWHDE
jgi:hypothetical protein